MTEMQGVNPDRLLLWGIYKEHVLSGPRRLEIEINNRCNLGCIFCWFHCPGNKKRGGNRELELPIYKGIVDDAADLGVRHVYITGRGEPCLHPDLPEMLRYTKSKGLYVTLTSNLTILTKNILASILLIDKLEITLCGYPADEYALMHRPKSDSIFPLLIRNIRRVSQIAALKGGPLTKINCILTKKNSGNIDALLAFCREAGIREIRLSPFSFIRQNRSLRMTSAQMSGLRRRFGGAGPHSGLTIDNAWLRMGDIMIEGCYMGWVAALVQESGKVKIGCFDSPFAPDGDIYKSTFKEIWYSQQAHANRLKLKNSLKNLVFCPFYSPALKKKGIFCPFALDNENIEKNLRNMAATRA